jgi:hypothetical protein
VSLEEPRPAYYLAVYGAECCPAWFVWEKLDSLTARVRCGHHLVLLVDGNSCSTCRTRFSSPDVSDWAQAQPEQVTCYLECVWNTIWGRYAKARWAMSVCAVAQGILIFGEPRRYRVLLRYASDVGIPYRILPVPGPDARPTPRPPDLPELPPIPADLRLLD